MIMTRCIVILFGTIPLVTTIVSTTNHSSMIFFSGRTFGRFTLYYQKSLIIPNLNITVHMFSQTS